MAARPAPEDDRLTCTKGCAMPLFWLIFTSVAIVVAAITLVDLFRHRRGGWLTAAWAVAVVIFPLIGSIVYWATRQYSSAEAGRPTARRATCGAARRSAPTTSDRPRPTAPWRAPACHGPAMSRSPAVLRRPRRDRPCCAGRHLTRPARTRGRIAHLDRQLVGLAQGDPDRGGAVRVLLRILERLETGEVDGHLDLLGEPRQAVCDQLDRSGAPATALRRASARPRSSSTAG